MKNAETGLSEREKIIARIQEALRSKAPRPGSHGDDSATTDATPEPPAAHAREWLPLVGNSIEEQLVLFAKNAAELKAEFHLLGNRDQLKPALAKIRDAEKWQRVATHDGALCRPAADSLGLPVLATDNGYDVEQLEKCDAGITECDLLVAQTGGVVVTSRGTGGRALTVLPPHHVVIARRDQIVPDLPGAFDWLQKKYSPRFPSMISFITGPSRTGDIERILVLGAHGPKKLTIFCV